MSSPPKRPRRQFISSTARLTEPALPLHLALAYIIVRVNPIGPNREPYALYATTFTASVLELVAQEVYELNDAPASYTNLRDSIEKLLAPQKRTIGRYNDKLRSRGHVVSGELAEAEHQANWMDIFGESFETVPDGCAFLDNLEKEIRDRINEDDEMDLTEVPEPIERRSPIGLFLRGILLALRKLSFDETAHLSAQVGQWCGNATVGPSLTQLWSLNRKTAMEDTLDKRAGAKQSFKSASSSGDYSAALSSLRRFYDYQFPSSTRGRHQHGLLNLASFHYSTGGLGSAKEAVDEAIRVARAEGDKSCLRSCMSLLHRLKAETTLSAFGPGENPRIGNRALTDARLPKAGSPMDELWSLNAALDLGEPVHVAMRRVYSALSRSENTSVKPDDKREPQGGWTTEFPFDEGAWHASQAGLWTSIGATSLAQVHEDLATNYADVDSDTLITVLLIRAERMAIGGDYDEALEALCNFTVLEHLPIQSYKSWSRVIWSILRRQAKLRDDTESLDVIQALDGGHNSSRRRGPGGPMRDEESEGEHDLNGGINLVHEEVRSSLSKARKLQTANSPPHLILPHVLFALHLSTQLGLWPLYREGVVSFAEVLLSMEDKGLGPKALVEVQDIWPDLADSGDTEIIARAQLVMAKAHIEATVDDDKPAFDSAVQHLNRALTSASKVQSRSLILECAALLDLIAAIQNDGREGEESTVKRQIDRTDAEAVKFRENVQRVGEIVKMVGVRVAGG